MHLSAFQRLVSSAHRVDYTNPVVVEADPSWTAVAECAYRIFLAEGCIHGRDLAHWFLAKHIMRPIPAIEL